MSVIGKCAFIFLAVCLSAYDAVLFLRVQYFEIFVAFKRRENLILSAVYRNTARRPHPSLH